MLRAVCALSALSLLAAGCVSLHRGGARHMPQGVFVDDYDDRFTISRTVFFQEPANRYHLVEWHVDSQYVIARNDDANPQHAGAWTRVDWMMLDMPPYTWAFCFTAWRAPSADAARNRPAPDRHQPRIGCNGYPFTRMRPVVGGSSR